MLERNTLVGCAAAGLTFSICWLASAGLDVPRPTALVLGLLFSGGTLAAFLRAARAPRRSPAARRGLFLLLGTGLAALGLALLLGPPTDRSALAAALALLAGVIYLGLAVYASSGSERRPGQR